MTEKLVGGSGAGLKDACQPRLEQLRRQTADGMAHWSGTGPENTTCLSCDFAVFNGYKTKGQFAALKPIKCRKYFDLTKTKGPGFDASKASCRFYIEGSGPPKRGA